MVGPPIRIRSMRTSSGRGFRRGGRAAASQPAEKKVVLLCQHFYPEMVSTGMHMTELATRLAELGWQITVLTSKPSWGTDDPDAGPVPAEMVYQNVRIIRVPTLGSQRGSMVSKTVSAVSFVPSVAWALWQRRADYRSLVITTNPPFVGVLGWLVSRVFRRPYLVIVYDVFPEFAISLGVVAPESWLARVWRRTTRMILCGAGVTVVIGRDMQKLIEERMPARLHHRIVMIPNWSDERRVHPVPAAANTFRQEHVAEGCFVVQYAGRLGEKHSLEPLIDAARLLSDSNVLFQLVGEGAKKPKLEALVAEYGLSNVQFLPYQPMHRLAEMLSAADLSVVCLEPGHTGISVPSKAYGVLASGTPILGILDPDGEIGQMIAETGCGVLVEPNGARIADVIRELMADAVKRTAMSDAGRAAFLEKYTLAKAAAAYDAVLSSLSNGGPRSIAGRQASNSPPPTAAHSTIGVRPEV
jgi:glycosyltransferase involved in cell wall biosynthesis